MRKIFNTKSIFSIDCLNKMIGAAAISIVVLSSSVLGTALQLNWIYSNNAWDEMSKRILLGSTLMPVIMVCLWLITPLLLAKKAEAAGEYRKYLILDSWSYGVFLLNAIQMFSFPNGHVALFIGPSVFLFLLIKIYLFRNSIIKKLSSNVLIAYQTTMAFIGVLVSFLRQYDKYAEKLIFLTKIVLVCYVVMSGLTRISAIYGVPVNKPYFTGEWDEPFVINAGINFLEYKGDQKFYNYGGTVAIPYAMLFLAYKCAYNTPVFYKYFNTAFFRSDNPIARKIHPVKPIYYGKILAIVLFTIGICAFVALFSWHLLPIPFLLFKIINHSSILAYYQPQLIGVTESTILVGLTTLYFVLALLTDEFKKYYRYLFICSILTSITIATKLNTAVIVLLPMALLIDIFRRFNYKEEFKWKQQLKIYLALMVPFVILTPAVILDPSTYFSWMSSMISQSPVPTFTFMDRIDKIFSFIRNIYLAQYMPDLTIIILVIMTSILMIRISPLAFGVFAFFHLYSFVSVMNISKYVLYDRLFIFLLLPSVFFVMFPLIYFYRKLLPSLRFVVLLICSAYMVMYMPPKVIFNDMKQIAKGTFPDWKKDSRDALQKYVIDNNLVVYFYDNHHFSLPDPIYNRIINFTSITEIPENLKANEVIGYIYYPETVVEPKQYEFKKIIYARYKIMEKKLNEKYKVVVKFGQGNKYDIFSDAPLSDPTIVLLK